MKSLVGILLALVALFGLLYFTGALDRGTFGGFNSPDLRREGVTSGEIICGAASANALTDLSGRNWLRITNNSTSTVWLNLTESTTGTASIGQGIQLDPVGKHSSGPTSTFSGVTYFDIGESNINWPHSIACIADVTSSLLSFIEVN